MVEFYINGQNVDVKIEDEETIGDLLNSFEQICEENEVSVIGINIDGRKITAETFDEEAKKSLSGNEKFDFTIITKEEIKQSFFKLSELFTELASKMEEVPSDLQNGKNLEVSESIKKLADSINQFSHTAALASLYPETFAETTIDGLTFNEFFGDFSSILKDFESALQNNDTIMIGDLSEYEICPRLRSIAEALNKF
ncbi:MAG: hypothetical protein K5786_01250 [Treponema sp.]|nr:hypothetical protein [Treponema sp.]